MTVSLFTIFRFWRPYEVPSQFTIFPSSRISRGHSSGCILMRRQLFPFEQALRWTAEAARRALAFDRTVPYLARVVLLAAVYFSAAKLALLAAIPPGYATAVWPP